MLQLAQNVCRQVFWTHQAHYETCCNMLKTSAGRCFGHTRNTSNIMKHAVTCSKRLPAGVLNIFVIKTDHRRIQVNELRLSFKVNTKTSACRWFWANLKPIFLSFLSWFLIDFLIDFCFKKISFRIKVNSKTRACRGFWAIKNQKNPDLLVASHINQEFQNPIQGFRTCKP